MTRLPRLTAQEIIKVLERKGFALVRQSGSHKIYRNPGGIRITVPFHPGKILHPKLLKSIADWAEPVIVHTGQHYDLNMSDAFFRDLMLPVYA